MGMTQIEMAISRTQKVRNLNLTWGHFEKYLAQIRRTCCSTAASNSRWSQKIIQTVHSLHVDAEGPKI